MTTYGLFCPAAKATEIVGENWTLLVLRELLLGSHRFGDFQRCVQVQKSDDDLDIELSMWDLQRNFDSATMPDWFALYPFAGVKTMISTGMVA